MRVYLKPHLLHLYEQWQRNNWNLWNDTFDIDHSLWCFSPINI